MPRRGSTSFGSGRATRGSITITTLSSSSLFVYRQAMDKNAGPSRGPLLKAVDHGKDESHVWLGEMRQRRVPLQGDAFDDEYMSSSVDSDLDVGQQDKPKRPRHRRGQSQPAMNHLFACKTLSPLVDEGEAWSSSCDEGSASEDDELQPHDKRDNLEYLDLSLSLPYALVSMRLQMLTYANLLEERMRSFCATHTENGDAGLTASFFSQLEAFRTELRALVTNALPSAPAGFQLPLIQDRAGKVLREHWPAHDWERLSSAVHSSLALRPHLPLSLASVGSEHARALAPELPSLPSLPDIDFAAFWTPLTRVLPSRDASVLLRIQRRFDDLQEAVRAMTLRDILFSAKTKASEGDSRPPASGSRRRSFIASQQALSRQFEAILESVKSKGEQVRSSGHARASSVVKAAWDAEEQFYAAACELARGGQRLIRYEHLPTLWRNNEFILSGYRFIPKERWGSLLKSTFEIHNETGNILTHLVGAVIVVPLFWPSKESFDEKATPMDRMVQTIYLGAALKCLLLSTAWHVMAGCSDACLFERFACVDYTGIAWLVAASVWTLVYNQFYCQPNLAMVYSLSTFIVGLVGAIVPWASWFNERRNKPIRIAVFLTMCFTALAPFTHSSLAHGFAKTVAFSSPILPSLASYIFGLVFYATQFPESRWPGRFDVVGHAHQIWHVSIVVAILLHYRATFYWHQERFNFSCAAPGLQGAADGLSHGGLVSQAVGASSSALFAALSRALSPLFDSSSLALDVNRADATVHGWRITAGTIGDGLVGRIWDRCVDSLMQTFATGKA